MATRRRIGISAATTEAARRQLMQPVPCWGKVWVTPENLPPGSTLKVFKWVKTEKIQQFSDDEGDVDEPLAPLPDEPEVVEGDEEMDQDEPAQSVPPGATSRDLSEPVIPKDEPQSKISTPKPHPLSVSFQPSMSTEAADDVLDESLKALDDSIANVSSVTDTLDPDALVNMDLSQLGPDGTAFEAEDDLTQMEATDAILGGELLDQSIDPFAETST